MKNKILIIGNSGLKHKGTDGQTVKVRLYLEVLKKENIYFTFIDLENGFRHLLKIIFNIKREINQCDRIVLLTASRGVRFFVPLINKFNKKGTPFILPMIGSNIVDKYLKKAKSSEYFNGNKQFKVSKKDLKNISKIDLILPENEAVKNIVLNCFPNAHVSILNNFRLNDVCKKNIRKTTNEIKAIYLSRVCKEKGILDIMHSISELNLKGFNYSLAIYGNNTLSGTDLNDFNNLLSDKIVYEGICDSSKSICTLRNYDLFIFPTRYFIEGTPGVISESLIAGTPILTSNFAIAKYLLKDKEDSIFYEFNSLEDLKKKLIYIHDNKKILTELSSNCILNSKKYTYDFNRDLFMRYICGK